MIPPARGLRTGLVNCLFEENCWALSPTVPGKAEFCKEKVESSDEGDYQFAVKNKHGTATVTVSVNVKLIERPAKAERFRVQAEDGNDIILSWLPPKQTGRAPVSSYLIEHRKNGCTDWLQVDETTECKISVKVTELGDGVFRIFSINADGQSEQPCYLPYNLHGQEDIQGKFFRFQEF